MPTLGNPRLRLRPFLLHQTESSFSLQFHYDVGANIFLVKPSKLGAIMGARGQGNTVTTKQIQRFWHSVSCRPEHHYLIEPQAPAATSVGIISLSLSSDGGLPRTRSGGQSALRTLSGSGPFSQALAIISFNGIVASANMAGSIKARASTSLRPCT
jgi:hypothetical protein